MDDRSRVLALTQRHADGGADEQRSDQGLLEGEPPRQLVDEHRQKRDQRHEMKDGIDAAKGLVVGHHRRGDANGNVQGGRHEKSIARRRRRRVRDDLLVGSHSRVAKGHEKAVVRRVDEHRSHEHRGDRQRSEAQVHRLSTNQSVLSASSAALVCVRRAQKAPAATRAAAAAAAAAPPTRVPTEQPRRHMPEPRRRPAGRMAAPAGSR